MRIRSRRYAEGNYEYFLAEDRNLGGVIDELIYSYFPACLIATPAGSLRHSTSSLKTIKSQCLAPVSKSVKTCEFRDTVFGKRFLAQAM